jgi:phosphoglycolate phosphatase-like HAD superfamily hydrolase
MLVLLWDIDGTLLSTDRAGLHAWQEAMTGLAGVPVNLATFNTAGLTDTLIAADLLGRFGLDPGLRDELVRRYEALLPVHLPRRAGRVLPGVREILDHVAAAAGVCSILLTGNTAAGGRAKLRHFGLDAYFAHGAFADGEPDRAAIARQALRRVRELVGDALDPERVYVIGDTPHDIHCARAIGARAVAVATGSYAVADLRRHEPWWVLPALPGPEAFLARLRAGEPG